MQLARESSLSSDLRNFLQDLLTPSEGRDELAEAVEDAESDCKPKLVWGTGVIAGDVRTAPRPRLKGGLG